MMSPNTLNPWLDSPARYGRISRLLHWSMVLLFFWQFLGMGAKVVLDWGPRDSWLVGSHAPMGFALLLVALLRLLWAASQWRRRPSHGRGLIAWAAKAGHVLLYALMLAVPALALMRAYGSGRGFDWLGWSVLPAGHKQPEWVQWVNSTRDALDMSLHGLLGWAMLALIVGHAAMALVHHFWLKDDTLRKMAGPMR